MNNLGGHDLPSLVEAFDKIDHDRPTCFICLHGQRLRPADRRPQGQSRRPDDAGADGDASAQAMNMRAGPRVGPVRRPAAPSRRSCKAFLDRVPFAPAAHAGCRRRSIAVPEQLAVTIQPEMSTQSGFGALLNELGREQTPLRRAHRHHLAGRHRLDQSRPLGQPPRPVRARDAWPTPSRASASPRPSTGSSRPRASTSSSASPR